MPTCAGSTRRAPRRPSPPREAARRLLRPGARAAHPRACAPAALPARRAVSALRTLVGHARAVRGLRAPLRARAGVLRRRHLHQLCGDGRDRGGGRARARLDRRADARPAARDRGGARRAGPARVLPPRAEPVAGGELPGGDGGAAQRAGTVAGALSGPALEVAELRYRYGERIALDGVSLRVERGELFRLLGPSSGCPPCDATAAFGMTRQRRPTCSWPRCSGGGY